MLVLMQCEAGSCGCVAAVSGHSVWLGWAGLGWAAGSDKIQVLEQAAAASQHQITRLMETRRH